MNFPPNQSSGSSGAGLRSSPPAGALPVPCPVGHPPPPPGPPPLQLRPSSGSAADSPPPLSVVADLNYRPKSNSGSSLAQSPPVTPSSNPSATFAAKEASMSGGASAAGSDSPTHSQVMNRLGSLDARLGEALTPPGKKQIWHPDSREPSITDPKSGNE